MHKRKKTKKISKSAVTEAVLSLNQSKAPPQSAYYNAFKLIVDSWKLHTLRTFLEEYLKELSVSPWDSKCLDVHEGQKLSDCVDEIISQCLPLGSLHDVTRFLFAKYSCQRARFNRKGVCKIRLPLSRFSEQLDDNVLMMSFVGSLNAALDRTNNNPSIVYKHNVYYVRRKGLSVLTLDRYDLIQPSVDAQFGMVYLLDALPYFFVVPLTIPIEVIREGLQSALGLRLRVMSPKLDLQLHAVIKEEAKSAGLRRDVFPDYLKDLLHFESNTLRRMKRVPELSKYPSQHECAFHNVSFEFTEGFEVSLRRRHHENLLESLYLLETRDELRLPGKFVKELAENSKNSFSAFEFTRASADRQ